MAKKGKFIVFEGLDGAGTTTQTARLVRWLETQGRTVVSHAEPTKGVIGRLIRQVLRSEVDVPPIGLLHLFLADRACHVVEVGQLLESGVTVVCDRYVMSTIAYQSLVVSPAQLATLNERFLKPDLTILLNVPVKTCLDRLAARRAEGEEPEIFETADRLERIERAYQSALSEVRARGWSVSPMSGMDDPDAVEKRARLEVARMFERG